MDNNIKSETPFAKAGFLSKLSFWWLNPLMKKGKKRVLQDDDIPMLRKMDRAETCYLMFMEQLKKQKQTEPSVLWVIILCYWKEILISGFFALVNTITLSASPLFLGAFINVAQGKESFKHEGYVLVILLLFTKFIESLSQRQWYFRCRLLGIEVRSLLSAAIYKKQLRVSSAAKTKLSAGEIINYVTVDCHRVGDFPFWLHQTWASCLQVCLGLAILFRAVGVASLAAFVVIVLSVLCNTPLAKLQHKFQSKLVIAQDKRLKAISEAILNIKVLKLYAWEMYFKSVIDKLRKEEVKFLEVTQRMKGYNTFLFWISPILVSTTTFLTCYFTGVPLYPSNVFTFLATLRVLQEPVTLTPDIIAITIHAQVAFRRIVNFLAAEELECKKFRQMECTEQRKHAISISSGNFSWEGNPSLLTLKSVNLEVKSGEKVSICGEVGAGKSTLLAAILGEVPKMGGMVQAYGKIAYVSQMAWIQSGSIQDNILFGCTMDKQRYQETIEKCLLVKDLQMLPYGDLTEIGERGINLSGGQKQRIQLARALYQDADIYLLDDPFSAVDADTAVTIFNVISQFPSICRYIGMTLAFGLALNMHLVFAVQVKCTLANDIISVERLNQYMQIPSEASEVIEENRPLPSWPAIGRVEIRDLKIRYRLNTPIVLHGISCTFEGGHKIGIVGRTGSGKSTLIGALFRLVEPIEGKIIIDGVDISTIGLHDLRSRLGIIPQDPTLFNGTVRYNLDPLSQHTDQEIWEVLAKCQLRETVQEKEEGLDSSVQQDGVNWSMGQRQLFCLGRALLRGSQILVLDEATASIDNTTDAILQQTMRTEFKKCTVITVAHRIPTVTDSSMVLVLSDGKIMEYDEPLKLIKVEGSLFGQLVKEYWSHIHSADSK
ncbi:hypothetical protein C5167_027316 [Papaver somniferum]|nr:hypothetical protein C5167_027316 [Papaver somniferum]